MRRVLSGGLFYGWVLVIIVFVFNVVITGTSFSFGVFFKSIESAFDLSRATTSSIISASMILGGVSGVLSGWALDRYGPRILGFLMGLFTGLSLLLTSQTNAAWQLFFTYSFLLAMGTGPIYVVTMSVVMRWFDKKRGLAVGVAGAGAGLGQVILAPLATFLIVNFDWRVAYLTLGLMAWALLLPTSRLFKGYPHEIGALPDGAKPDSTETSSANPNAGIENFQVTGLSFSQALKTRSFWLFIFVWFLFAVSMLMAMTHIIPYATDIGFSATQSAIILSIVGALTTVGTLLMGILCDRVGRKRAAIISTLFIAASMTWLVWADSLWMLYIFAVVFGFGSGGLMASSTALLGDTFGLSRIGTILGVIDIGWWSGAAIGPILGGFIFDVNQSYFVAFLIAAVAMYIVMLLLVFVRREADRLSLA
jgi:MFS family permease